MDNNKKIQGVLEDIRNYEKISIVAESLTAKATRETAGPDDEKQRALLTQIRDHLATIVRGLFGGSTSGTDGETLSKDGGNTPLLPGPSGGKNKQKQGSQFTKNFSDFFSGMKQGYAETLQYFTNLKEDEVKSDKLQLAKQEKQQGKMGTEAASVPDNRSIVDILESIDTRLAGMQFFGKNKGGTIEGDFKEVGQQLSLPEVAPVATKAPSLEFEMLPDISEDLAKLENEVNEASLDPERKSALANQLQGVSKKLGYKPAKPTIGKKVVTSNYPAGVTTRSGSIMADVPTFLRRKKGMGSLELGDVGVQASPSLIKSEGGIQASPSLIKSEGGEQFLKSIAADTKETKDILNDIKESIEEIGSDSFISSLSEGMLGAFSTVAATLVGGIAATLGATGILASPAAEGLRKATAGNSMLGAMSGDTAMAGAILDANGPDSVEKVRERQSAKKEALKESPWYTRIYGVGEEKYLKEQGYSQDQIDEMRGKNSVADLEAQKEEMETTLGSRKWMNPEDQKKYDEINQKLEGKKTRLSSAQMTTSGIELNNDSAENKELLSNGSNVIQPAPLINNVVSNNTSQSFVPIKPTPRASQSSFERFQDRLVKG